MFRSEMAGSGATSKGDKGFVRELCNYDPVRFKFTNEEPTGSGGVQIKKVIHIAVRREDATSLAKVKEKILERRTVKGYSKFDPRYPQRGEYVDIPKSEVS